MGRPEYSSLGRPYLSTTRSRRWHPRWKHEHPEITRPDRKGSRAWNPPLRLYSILSSSSRLPPLSSTLTLVDFSFIHPSQSPSVLVRLASITAKPSPVRDTEGCDLGSWERASSIVAVGQELIRRSLGVQSTRPVCKQGWDFSLPATNISSGGCVLLQTSQIARGRCLRLQSED